ncbi:hypothetical protein ONS95_000704 [Cadophora gregata]|uniref:uncharacterized protein n=1 Tax=Cadophora gregata TaxID=51156 RepID=UPI0026DB9D50|nr:uncharacterized protein ONS95_000704 [Cadophora gregata]KAK0128750.1 hypothetical protein ONS95_000704 [Cadophora gregata]
MDVDFLSECLQNGLPSQGKETLLSNLPHSALTQADDYDQNISNNEVLVTRTVNPNSAGAVISKIEDIFEAIADCILAEGKELVIELKSRSKSKTQVEADAMEGPKGRMRRITFPSRNQKEAWKFTALLRILELSHEALVTGVITTKRLMSIHDPQSRDNLSFIQS